MISRRVQILVRRRIAQHIRKKNCHLWPIDPNAAQPPENWKGWPEGRQFALVLCHDVDTLVGYNNVLKVAELDERMGFCSYFSFVPERYGKISLDLLDELRRRGFDVAIHGLKHDGRLFFSKRIFDRQAPRINAYLKKWKSAGFTSPSMQRNLEWMTSLNINYSTSTFDTDPFEPEPDGVGTIFPFAVYKGSCEPSAISKQLTPSSCPTSYDLTAINSLPMSYELSRSFIELPYTLPQDSTLFVILQEKTIDIWKRKLDWIAEKGGMALLNTHPDYMNCRNGRCGLEEYPIRFYEEFLNYVKAKFEGQYWHVIPKEMARFWKEKMVLNPSEQKSSKP